MLDAGITLPVAGRSPLYDQLVSDGHAGLVLFTSGTTGDPKAAVQDLDRLRLRYAMPREVGKMLAFMQVDHIGGVNTLLYVISHGGTLVVPASRTPHDVAAAVESHRIEVLPVSPTFFNLMLIGRRNDRVPASIGWVVKAADELLHPVRGIGLD